MVVVIKKGQKKKEIIKKLESLKGGKKFPARKFMGKIKIDEDAMIIQNRLRNEWKERIS